MSHHEEKEPHWIVETARSVNQYWFGYGSPVALGLFRIVMASLTVINLIMVSLDWDAWFSEKGYVPSWLGGLFVVDRINVGYGTNWTLPRLGVLNHVTDPRIGIAVYAVTLLAGIFTAFGLWTRVSSIILAIGLVSLHHRNAAILHGGDTLMRVSALYLAIAPSGAACSVDRLIGVWKGKLDKVPALISMWPQRLISYNMALLYLTTIWLKWGGGMWRDGTATYYPARLGEFERFPIPHWINDFPTVYVTTYGTLFTEFALGTLVFFKPLRKYVLFAGILMHLHIEISMNIPLFSYLMVSGYITFYEGDEVVGWAARLGQRLKKFRLKVAYPAGTRLTAAGANFMEVIDPLKLVNYAPGSTDQWTATKADDAPIRPTKAISTRSIGSWCFAWIPGIWNKILPKALEPAPQGSKAPRKEPEHARRS